MCKIDWNLLIQSLTAFGTIAVVIIAIWGDLIRYYLYPPQLKIELLNSKGDLGTKQKIIYYHLKVVNKRHWAVAKNCRVVLKEFHYELPNRQWQKQQMTVDSTFFWSPQKETPLHVDISHEQVFDFIIAKENPICVLPRLNFYPQSFNVTLGANQKMIYGLEIKADGYKSKKIQLFEVAWNGKWHDNLDYMSNNLTIREIETLH